MAEETENIDALVESFKEKGISCKDLARKENQRRDLAKEARRDGMLKVAEGDEAVASRLKSIRTKICGLKWKSVKKQLD